MDLATLARYPIHPETGVYLKEQDVTLDDLVFSSAYVQARDAGRRRMLEASLDRTFALVSEERALIMADVEEMIAREREIIFEELRAMTPDLVGQVEDTAISVVDHVLLRLAIGIGILVVVLGLGWLIFRPRAGSATA